MASKSATAWHQNVVAMELGIERNTVLPQT
jgi:hypothetical protein